MDKAFILPASLQILEFGTFVKNWLFCIIYILLCAIQKFRGSANHTDKYGFVLLLYQA